MKIKKLNINKLKRIKPGTIRITAVDNRFYNNSPYVNSKSHLPQWFRRVHKGEGSIRSCAGISDFLEFGITIPAWTNFKFTPNVNRGVWEIMADGLNPSIEFQMASGFMYEQTGSCPMTDIRRIEKMSYPKLTNPWRIQTAPGWSSLMLPILFEENENYSVLPAIVNSDYYQAMNIVINPKTDKEFKILQGTPLVHLIPIERKNDISNIEFIDESFFKYASANMYMTGGTIPGASGKQGIAYKKAQKVVDGFLENKSPWYKKG